MPNNAVTKVAVKRRSYGKRKMIKKPSRWEVYGNAGSQLWKDVKMLKNLINVEFKVVEKYESGISAPNSGTISCLNALQQGDDFNRRSGRQVRIKSLQLRFSVTKHTSATASRARVIIFIDKDPNQVQCSTSDVLENSTASTIKAFRKLDFRKRFILLKDNVFTLNADTPEQMFVLYKEMDLKVVYDASNNGDISDIISNSIHILVIGDESTNTPTFEYNTRIRFIDN